MKPGVLRAVASAFPIWVACISGRHLEKGGLPLGIVSLMVSIWSLETLFPFFESLPFAFCAQKFGHDFWKFEVRGDCSLGANRRCFGKVSERIAGKLLVAGGLRLTLPCLPGSL